MERRRGMLKLAIDNQIALLVVQQLKRNYEVVMIAGDLPDVVWIEQALDNGATVFISPDLDVPLYLDKNYEDFGLIWIDIPQGLRASGQLAFISKKLSEIKV